MMDPKNNIEKLIAEKNVQFRDFNLTAIEIRKAGEDEGKEEMIVEGVAATFEQPTTLYRCEDYEIREIIAKGAFDECEMNDVIFNFNHCGRVYARTRNDSLQLSVEDDGLHMRAVLNPDDNGHQELYRDIKTGLIDKMSFAFTVKENTWEFKEADGFEVDTRTITKIDRLYDVSAVDIPAYDTTSISARHAFEPVRSEHTEEIRKAKEAKEKEVRLALARYNYLNCEV